MAKTKGSIPFVLPVSPLNLLCPLCKAEPGHDCTSGSGGLIHMARIKAAALADKDKKR